MGQSIGELFVKLGFDVDTSKLRDFDEGIQSVYSGLLKFSALAGTGAGIYEVTKGVAETANQWRNFRSEVGGSTNELQKFIALYTTVNPLSSLNQAQQVATHIQQYGSNIFRGGDGSAYGKFGGNPSDFINPATGQIDPELILPKITARLISGRALALSTVGGDVGQLNKLITEITGSPDTINMLNASPAQKEAADKSLNLINQQINDTEHATESLSQLRLTWDNFVNHAIASLAPGAAGFLDTVNKKGLWAGVDWIGEHSYLPGAVDWIGKNAYIGHPLAAVGNWEAGKVAGLGASVSHAAGSVIKNFSPNARQSAAFWRAQGYSNPQIAAWLAQEQSESSYGMDKNMNAHGHFGAFQWSAERAAKILAGTGIDVKTASHADQLVAANWELQQMGLAKDFRGLNNPQEASRFLSKKFEAHEKYNAQHGDEAAYRARMAQDMATTNNVTINVQSNSADAEEVAQRVHQRFIDVTYPTKNVGSVF